MTSQYGDATMDGEGTVPNERAVWQTPRLMVLDLDMDDVENGHANGNDGAGGFTTSMAS